MHETLYELTTKLRTLSRDGNFDPQQFGTLLDNLNSLNLGSIPFKQPWEIRDCIHTLCIYLSPDDEYLAPKCAEFIYKICNHNGNRKMSGSNEFGYNMMPLTIEWCLNAAKLSNNPKHIVAALKGLEGCIRAKVRYSYRDNVIWKKLEPLCQPQYIDDGILYRSVKCLEALTAADILPYNNPNMIEQYYSVFVNLLGSPAIYTRKSHMAFKIIERCLIALKNIFSTDQNYVSKDLTLLLGFVKSYMVFGMGGVEFLKPERLVPTLLSVPPPPSKQNVIKVRPKKNGKKHGSNKKTHEEPKLKKNLEYKPEMFDIASSTYIPVPTVSNSVETNKETACTSDSEFSDSDIEKLTLVTNRVQQAALNLFVEVIKHVDKAVVFTYWNSFIPERLGVTRHNLITCCMNDSSYRTVMCALNVLLKLLLYCKPYLNEAKVSENPSASFTPFSAVLGLSLIELHKSLCHILRQNVCTVLTQVLKCLSALVQATPYHQMPRGLITNLVRKVKPLVYHKDPSVQVTALGVMGCLLVVDPPISEIQNALSQLNRIEGVSVKVPKPTKPSTSLDEFDFAHFSSSEDEEETDVKVDSVPWLLKLCLVNLGVIETPKEYVPAPVQLECLQIISAMSRNYLDSMILPYLGPITCALENAFSAVSEQIVHYAARTANFLGNAMLKNCNNENASAFLGFWQTLLNKPLVKLLQNDDLPHARAAGCDCLSSIGARLFQKLPNHKQILCVTLLLSCSEEEDENVRGAAIRALSLYVDYPILRADSGFVMDTSQAILANIKNKNQNVRIKVSWALATLTDALVQPQIDCPTEPLPQQLYLKFLKAGIEGAADVDQICTNAVRTLGNVLQLLDDEMLCKTEFKTATLAALEALETACTSGKKTKARWNACYALASAMKNPRLFQDNLATWKSTTLPKLADTAVNFNNFKVRIGAVQALTAPARREFYGSQFDLVWTALLQSLEKCQAVSDVTEFNRRDQLQEQICLGIGHLTGLLTREDLPQVESHLARYVEILKTHVRKVLDGLVPEKSTELFNAVSHLEELRVQCRNTCEKRAVDILTAIFVSQ